ncbi:MAG: hypothetical protein ACKVS8_07355 [Phycisphaerales bacterium]
MNMRVFGRAASLCLGMAALLASAGSAAAGVTVTLMPGGALTIPRGGSVNVGVVIQFTGLTPLPTDLRGLAVAVLDVQLGAMTPAGITLGSFIPPPFMSRGPASVSQPLPVGASPGLDHNGDTFVESGDFLAFATDWNAEFISGTSFAADYNNDLEVNPDDYADYIQDFYSLRDPFAAVLPGVLDVAVAGFESHPFSAGGMTMSNAVLIGSFTVNASASAALDSVFTLDVNPLSSASLEPLGRGGAPFAGDSKRAGDLIGDSITFTVVVPAPGAAAVAGLGTLAGLGRRSRRR